MNAPAIAAIKAQTKAMWTAGDFGQIAKFTEPAAEAFIKRRAISEGMQVLDAACGTGNAAIPAATVGAYVTGVDIAPNLIEAARERARQARLNIRFDEGDVEDLPYGDASFDLVVSMFGAMFAPRPERAAAELLRVCRPGGQIAMANWAPRGFIREQHDVMGRQLPLPPGRGVSPGMGRRSERARAARRQRHGAARDSRYGDAEVPVLRAGNGRVLPHLLRPGAARLCRSLRGAAGRPAARHGGRL
jgi:SAM-dependent methyltransferase